MWERRKRLPERPAVRVSGAGSVDGASRYDPLARLPGDSGNPIEVGVVVENRKIPSLRGGSDQQIWHLTAALVPCGEQALNLPGPEHVIGRGLHKLKCTKALRQSIPLVGVAS